MEKIFCGKTGEMGLKAEKKFSDLPVDKKLISSLITFYGGDNYLRPAQEKTIFEYELLEERRNVLLTTPTNSGKTLIAYLMLFREAQKGKKAILIEPMRALAQEKLDELIQISDALRQNGGSDIKITISTGDYRLNDQFMDDNVERKKLNRRQGEIVVATPERLDSISRIKEHEQWFDDISLVCIDEAHLIGDPSRGATLEMLITYLRSLRNNPQLVLLSATIANGDELADWLRPCLIVKDIPRYPVLEKWVYGLDEKDDANCCIADEVESVLKIDNASILIFVYRTESAESVARFLIEKLCGVKIKKGDLDIAIGNRIAWYHASLSAASRNKVRKALLKDEVRVVVSTTALAMGVNLPTTHVFIRDITFPGAKELDIGELTQMIGRAGRGSKPGVGVIFHHHKDKIALDDLACGLEEEVYPSLTSQFVKVNRDASYYGFDSRASNQFSQYQSSRVSNQLLGVLHRLNPVKYDQLVDYFSLSWGGKDYVENVAADLDKLGKWKLVYYDDDLQTNNLTSLGKTAARCYLPPLTAANIGQLFRDLVEDRPDGEHLKYFSPIDLLVILCLASDELRPFARFSVNIKKQVESYMEALPIPEKSYLYRKWIRTEPAALIGSLSVDNVIKEKDAEKKVYQKTYLAMLLYDLASGKRGGDLKEFYRVEVEEVEEKIRDTVLWLLYGLEQILGIPNFYYHLKTKCDLPEEGIVQIDNEFKRLSGYIFSLLPNLKYRSALGELIRGIKRVFPNHERYPSEKTIQRLEEAGIGSIQALVGKTPEDLVAVGVQSNFAEQITGYIQRRVSS